MTTKAKGIRISDELDQEIHREDLLPEVALVELGAEHQLAQPLELGQGEPARE